ncbi:type II toxin-antitoxin system RelE/ParE family toxin [Pararhizobium sp. LjRoot255]|uniref:type II toxin-antitoxin system RelE/ParE family toxin n=1 Tax=Pararhizobium sp. LjRoot255 TaxID=3342298 RepID=UPI003ECF0643
MTINSRKPIFSQAARADLRSIFKYIAIKNPEAAANFVLDINLKVRSIGQALRGLPYRDRCIYFRVTDSHIYIVRILHGRQDISSEDFPESEI